MQTSAQKAPQNNLTALSVLTSLFFMMGFITCLNDILIPHLEHVFQLTNRGAMLVQTAFFSAYGLMSILVGKVIDKIGYKRTVVVGFIITAIGAALFYPATAMIPTEGHANKILYYIVFLPVFFIMATGIVFLQTAGNPYVTLLAPKGKESVTLTLVQGFNSVATTIAPKVGGLLILADAGMKLSDAQQAQRLQIPYLGLAGLLLILAGLFVAVKLPAAEQIAEEIHNHSNHDNRTSVIQYKHLVLGAIAIFCYVGAEVAIGSQYVLTMEHLTAGQMTRQLSSGLLSYYWGGAMIGRFLGGALMNKIAANKALLFNSLVAMSLLLITILFGDAYDANVAKYALLAIGLFNSIMFPTIFSLATRGLGKFTADGSGIISTAIVGGAVIPLLQGDLVTRMGDNYLIPYIIPALCYLYIAFFAAKGHKVD